MIEVNPADFLLSESELQEASGRGFVPSDSEFGALHMHISPLKMTTAKVKGSGEIKVVTRVLLSTGVMLVHQTVGYKDTKNIFPFWVTVSTPEGEKEYDYVNKYTIPDFRVVDSWNPAEIEHFELKAVLTNNLVYAVAMMIADCGFMLREREYEARHSAMGLLSNYRERLKSKVHVSLSHCAVDLEMDGKVLVDRIENGNVQEGAANEGLPF